MIEKEWSASEDPQAMLAWATQDRMPSHSPTDPLVSDRKRRLFACACCRQVWHLLTDDRNREAVKVAERFADGEATEEEKYATEEESWVALTVADQEGTVPAFAHATLANAARAVSWERSEESWSLLPKNRYPQFANLLRDIIGNPWRPMEFWDDQPVMHFGVQMLSRRWLTPTVLAIAQAIYRDRTFEEMPILADALEEAGCDNESILQHLRGWEWGHGQLSDSWYWMELRGSHVRGCHVLDFLLGKE